MTPYKQIGECVISTRDADYFFRPSLLAMASIGEPDEIVRVFYELHHDPFTELLKSALDAYSTIPNWLIEYINKASFAKPAIVASMRVLQACCSDDITPLIGEMVPSKKSPDRLLYRKGQLSAPEMIHVARSLITHGVAGKAKLRQLQRNEGGTTKEFDAFSYISSARHNLNLSRAEAEQLTMTEFQLMLNAKFPNQKGLTREEYDAVRDNYFANRDEREKQRQAARAKKREDVKTFEQLRELNRQSARTKK